MSLLLKPVLYVQPILQTEWQVEMNFYSTQQLYKWYQSSLSCCNSEYSFYTVKSLFQSIVRVNNKSLKPYIHLIFLSHVFCSVYFLLQASTIFRFATWVWKTTAPMSAKWASLWAAVPLCPVQPGSMCRVSKPIFYREGGCKRSTWDNFSHDRSLNQGR